MPSTHTILVVEDDQDVRDAFVQVLQCDGYEAVPASDGEEALTQLQAGLDPCLIVLDLMMPGMDGFQFMNEKRKDLKLSPIPVIISSGIYDAKQNAARLGAEDYFQKPIDRDRLLNVVGGHRRAHLRLVRAGDTK